MKDEKDLLYFASDIDCSITDLEDVLQAMALLDDAISHEEEMMGAVTEAYIAKCFMDRLPMFVATYRVLLNSLRGIRGDLQKITEQMYKTNRKQSGKVSNS